MRRVARHMSVGRADGRPIVMYRIATWHVGSTCCSPSQSTANNMRRNRRTAIQWRPKASTFIGAVGVSPAGGVILKRVFPTGSVWSRSAGIANRGDRRGGRGRGGDGGWSRPRP